MRERVSLPSTDAPGSPAGLVTRSFRVCLAPLAEPIDAAELDMMLQGLGDMGAVENTVDVSPRLRTANVEPRIWAALWKVILKPSPRSRSPP